MNQFVAAYLDGFHHSLKTAAAELPAAYMGLVQQKYMPQYKRRDDLEGFEEELVDKGRRRPIPKIFKSDADHPSVDMASPGVSAGVAGAGGAVVGGLLGAPLGAIIAGSNDKDPETGAQLGAGLGAVTTGLITGLMGYHGRQAVNDSIVEAMRRLPAGATRRDMKADPVYQAEQDRMNQLMAAQMMAARG